MLADPTAALALISKKLSCEFADQVQDKFANEDSILLIESICESWANHFHDSNISYTTYDKIHSSFRQRIFGVF